MWGGGVVYGGAGNDIIQAEYEDAELHGGEGDDDIDGGAGNDQLFGGGGRDTLYGDFGRDMFVFDGADGNSHDTITDFAPGWDHILFTGDTNVSSFQDLIDNHIIDQEGGAVISYMNGDASATITLAGGADGGLVCG